MTSQIGARLGNPLLRRSQDINFFTCSTERQKEKKKCTRDSCYCILPRAWSGGFGKPNSAHPWAGIAALKTFSFSPTFLSWLSLPSLPPGRPDFKSLCFFCFCVDLCVSVSLTLGLIYLSILSLPCTLLRRYSPDVKHDVIPRFSRPFPSFFCLCEWPPLEIAKSWENRCYTCRCCYSPHVFFLLLSSSRNKSSLFFLPPQPCLTSARPPAGSLPPARAGRPIRAPGITEPEPNLEPSLCVHHNLKFVVRKKTFGPIAADEPHNCQARHNSARPPSGPAGRCQTEVHWWESRVSRAPWCTLLPWQLRPLIILFF